MTEKHQTYTLESLSRKLPNGRFSIEVRVSTIIDGVVKSEAFKDSSSQSMILLIEAEFESVALGKRLIDRGLVRF